jgi:membrane protease YdiL (CAAX protease family)
VNRLWGLLVALCTGALAASSPFLLSALRGVPAPISPAAILALQVLQTLLLCALAAWSGVRFAPRAGLDAPFLRSIAAGEARPPAFGSAAIEAAAVGSITAIAVTVFALLLRSAVPEALSQPPPVGFWTAASSAFYGGIVEETLLRWGLLTALVVLLRRFVREAFWPANVLTALVFAALHLPGVALARLPFSAGVIAYVFLGNGIAGTVFGWVFRRRGLEGAMVAHAAADLWLKAALPALLA